MNHQFGALSLFELTGDVNTPDDERADTTVVPDNSVSKFQETAELAAALGGKDEDWKLAEQFLATTPEDKPVAPHKSDLSKEFLERSDARLHRVAEKIRRIFGSHVEEAEEAIALAKNMRDSARSMVNI